MTDDRTKQKAMEAVADIYGKHSLASDIKIFNKHAVVAVPSFFFVLF